NLKRNDFLKAKENYDSWKNYENDVSNEFDFDNEEDVFAKNEPEETLPNALWSKIKSAATPNISNDTIESNTENFSFEEDSADDEISVEEPNESSASSFTEEEHTETPSKPGKQASKTLKNILKNRRRAMNYSIPKRNECRPLPL